MRTSENLEGCIGTFNPADTGTYLPKDLSAEGATQSMVFPTADEADPEKDGPYWMHVSERIKWMNDIRGKKKQGNALKVTEARALLEQHNLPTDGLKKELENRLKRAGLPTHHIEIQRDTTHEEKMLRQELVTSLDAEGIDSSGNYDQLVARCNANGLPITKQVPDVIEGWAGKAKGKRQVLWERKHINPAKIDKYCEKGYQEPTGEIDETTSYDALLNGCRDFANELTLVQTVMLELGSFCDRSPKCHPEVAGEGIEYSLGKSKNYFRTFGTDKKKGKDKFKALVEMSLKHDEGAEISIERVRKYCRKARRYIIAYHQFDRGEKVDDAETLSRIERNLERLTKSHRDPQETKFIYES